MPGPIDKLKELAKKFADKLEAERLRENAAREAVGKPPGPVMPGVESAARAGERAGQWLRGKLEPAEDLDAPRDDYGAGTGPDWHPPGKLRDAQMAMRKLFADRQPRPLSRREAEFLVATGAGTTKSSEDDPGHFVSNIEIPPTPEEAQAIKARELDRQIAEVAAAKDAHKLSQRGGGRN